MYSCTCLHTCSDVCLIYKITPVTQNASTYLLGLRACQSHRFSLKTRQLGLRCYNWTVHIISARYQKNTRLLQSQQLIWQLVRGWQCPAKLLQGSRLGLHRQYVQKNARFCLQMTQTSYVYSKKYRIAACLQSRIDTVNEDETCQRCALQLLCIDTMNEDETCQRCALQLVVCKNKRVNQRTPQTKQQ